MTFTKIRDLINQEKPREKLIASGPFCLNDIELIALLIRNGGKEDSAIDLSRKLLTQFESLKGLICSDVNELMKVKGIGSAKATAIKAAGEIALRINSSIPNKNLEIKKPEDVYKLIRKNIYGKKKENLFVISLDTRNRLISENLISVGTINEALIHPREIYKEALIHDAVSIILVHNHPSNDPFPSEEDIKVTSRIAKAGIQIGIPLLDHIVASDDSFISMKSLNLIEPLSKGGEKNN